MAERCEVYKRADGKWAWRLIAENDRIVATDGSQGYENKGDAETMATRVVRGDWKAAPIVLVEEPANKLS